MKTKFLSDPLSDMKEVGFLTRFFKLLGSSKLMLISPAIIMLSQHFKYSLSVFEISLKISLLLKFLGQYVFRKHFILEKLVL